MSNAAWILTSSTAAVAAAGTALLVWASGHRGPRSPRAPRRGGNGATAPEPKQAAHPAIPVVQRANLEAHLAALEGSAADGACGITVFYIGLDGMQFVNRHYGHALGDRLLLATGERLRGLKHAPDGIAHIGGDEFVVFVARPIDSQRIHEIVWNILDTVVQPHESMDGQVSVSCSVGICSHPQQGPVHRLLVHAHAAMCTAKARGRGSFAFHAGAEETSRGRTRDIERHLRSAMANQEFHLVFQPKIDMASGRATAAEALIRWQHPVLGTVPPDVFLPIAERLGLGGAIGEWVLDEACRQAQAWRSHGLRMRVAVNLSARQLLQPHLVRQILAILEHHGIPPSGLTCEITEPLAMENLKAGAQVLEGLQQAGVHLAIDDFGTGHSNLGYLRRLPVQELKIDRGFVRELGACARADAIVEAIVAMAHALGQRVVAGGIENDLQLGTLRRLGCDEIQGYLFSGPVAPPALLAWALANAKEQRPGAAEPPAREADALAPLLPGGA